MNKISIPKTINPDIDIERKNSGLNKEEFTIWFYGGENILQMKRLIETELFEDFENPLQSEFLPYEKLITQSVKDTIRAAKKKKIIQNRYNPGGTDMYPLLTIAPYGRAITSLGDAFAVHIYMFTKVIKGQGTAEQYEMFGRRADNFEIIGTYAQTELGHGTYLQGLEARADYDRETQEFILNTPTLTSYKWWPGGLGHACNYAIVVLQLFIDGISKGIQMFVVQIRDEETFMPLPGIHVGEIGKKVAINGLNNGFLGLKNVRIPRINMLMKNHQVLPDGTFIEGPPSKLSYFPMVYVRCLISVDNMFLYAQAATIAIRYSVVRHQSPLNDGEPEPKIIEHVTQQMKILPEIANIISYRLASENLLRLYKKTTHDIAKKDYSRLQELHALACILKVSCSYDSTFGIERMRQSCGGHGYMVASNFGYLFGCASAACTYEGENSVLYLQVGKILIKSWSDILSGKQLMPTLSYLMECANWKSFPKWSGDWYCLVQALQYTCAGSTRIAYKNYQAYLNQGLSQGSATNNTGLQLAKAAELHGRSYVAHTFYQEVENLHKKTKRSFEFQNVLENLLELHLLQMFFRYLGDILRFIPLQENEIEDLQFRLESVLQKLRPDVVSIVDGFDFDDRVINSVLGSYDGNVYERLFESALKHPLNQKSVPDFFETDLKPFLQENAVMAKRAKL